MKLAYERPMMHAEMYQTNAYCNSCGDTFVEDVKIDKDCTWFEAASTKNIGSSWRPNNVTYIPETGGNVFEEDDFLDGYSYEHTFSAGAATGVTNEGSSIWKCEDNDRYYLEWSNGYTERSGHDVYFLYYDANNDGNITAAAASEWPAVGNGFVDYVLGCVVPVFRLGNVVNS